MSIHKEFAKRAGVLVSAAWISLLPAQQLQAEAPDHDTTDPYEKTITADDLESAFYPNGRFSPERLIEEARALPEEAEPLVAYSELVLFLGALDECEDYTPDETKLDAYLQSIEREIDEPQINLLIETHFPREYGFNWWGILFARVLLENDLSLDYLDAFADDRQCDFAKDVSELKPEIAALFDLRESGAGDE